MKRHNFDYKKYGGRLDPDENIFFGPVTVRELKRSMELAEELFKTKKNTKLTTTVDKEDIVENQLNRTYDLDEAEKLDTTFEVKSDQGNNQPLLLLPVNPLKDISNMTVVSALDNMKLTDSPRDQSFQKHLFLKKGSLLDDTVISVIRDNLQTPLIDKFPQKCSSKTVADGIVTTSSQVNSNVTKNYVNSTSISSKVTVNRGNQHSPLVNKLPKKYAEKVGIQNEIVSSSAEVDSVIASTPKITKLSDTFVTELLEENCLVDSPVNNHLSQVAKSKNESTPDVFSLKQNDIWKKDSSVKKSGGMHYFKSKLPITKRPNYFKSPVADYIHRGLQVQSMSKLRHSHCVISEEIPKSKSDNKNYKSCKIPVSVHVAAKRKLNLNKSIVKK